MAKRSPILGYNHNVLYRGLVFHVQTEDSGQLSPHLFTHLFYGGVIISTRKLVYDAGSAEDAIKGLMQAQHKVVLKDLKKGTFDDKIDAYLVGTEGLLPRTSPPTATPAPTPTATPTPARAWPAEVPPPPAAEVPRVSAPEITIHRPGTEELEQIDAIDDQPSEPMITIEPGPAIARTATPPPIPRAATPAARTVTAERRSGSSGMRAVVPPPPDASEIDPPTDPDVDSDAVYAAVNATVKTPMIEDGDSAPEISIKLELEDDEANADPRTRTKHDTEVQSDGVPGAIGAAPSSPNPVAPPERKTGERVSALGAAALPPARPIARPPARQAIAPPAVMSRPVSEADRSDAVEVYAPPPSSADAPPGERSERPGQYAQHKKPSAKLPVDVLKGERSATGSFPIPSGLSRPGTARPAPAAAPTRASSPSSQPVVSPRTSSQSSPVAQARTGTPGSQPAPAPTRPPSSPHQVPRVHSPSEPPAIGRTSTPSRVSPAGTPNVRTSASGGVVMTRPAVIVGAPAKPAAPPRVRKAREEEGRGFGQGLISEKSLDEVILAYLSEDAEDK